MTTLIELCQGDIVDVRSRGRTSDLYGQTKRGLGHFYGYRTKGQLSKKCSKPGQPKKCPFTGITAFGINGGSYKSGQVIAFRKLLHTFGANKNVYNTGNSRFTAPVTGVYKLSFAILSASSGAYNEYDWWVNGRDTNIGCFDAIKGKGHTTCMTSSILQLNSGDYVEVRSHHRTYVTAKSPFANHLPHEQRLHLCFCQIVDLDGQQTRQGSDPYFG